MSSFGHGYSIVRSNSNGQLQKGFGYGHGHGMDLNKGNVSFFTKSPAEHCNSIGYGFGHGKCFYRSSISFIYEIEIEQDFDSSSDSGVESDAGNGK